MPPSLEKANIILEFDVMENNPQCHTQIIIKHMSTTAPSSPKTSMNICKTGCPTVLVTVPSKSWMLKRKESSTKSPNRDEKPTDEMTPIGALQLAFLVSSDKCAEASNPVNVYCDIKAPQQAKYAGEALTLHPGSGATPVPS